MPIMDGTAVVQAIRAHSDAYVKTIPIVVFSAAPMHLRAAALHAGANAILEKPCPRHILLQFVEMYLGDGICGGMS
jgi:CheY-like chemotaxis protein